MKNRLHPILCLGLLASPTITTSYAATDIWDGGQAGNIAWGQPANWLSDIHPAFDDAQEVVFYQSGAGHADRSNIGADRNLNKITINGNVDSPMMIAIEANNGPGRQLRFGGSGAGIFIDADAAGEIRLGESNVNNEGNTRIKDTATFSGTGKGIDIDHNGTGELIISGTQAFFEADTGGGGAGGAASIAKTGSGTMTIETDNAITGSFFLTEGRVNFNNNSSGGNNGVTWVIGDGMTLGNTTGGQVTIDADPDITLLGELNYLSEGDRNLQVGSTATSTITLENDSTINVGSGLAAGLYLEGVVEESGGSYGITKTGLGVLRFRAPLNHTGGITINDGEVHFGETGGTPATMASGTFTINSPGVLVDRGGATDRTWNNVITGDGSLSKIDGHKLTLTGTSTYTGSTTVNNGGTLMLTGTHQSGGAINAFYQVNNVATLAGDGGATESDVTVVPGASIDPGKGGFTIGYDSFSYHYLAGANVKIEVDAPGDADQLVFNGALTLSDLTDGDAVLDLTGSDINAPTASPITILDGTTEPVTGTFAGLPENTVFVLAGQQMQINYAAGGDGFDVVLTPVNDPVVTIAADSTAVTEGGTAGFTITANPPPSGADVTVNLSYSGTASDGSDFTGMASILVLDGQPTADLDLTTIDDGLLEGPETLIVQIDSVSGSGAALGGMNSASLSLIDGNSAPFESAGALGSVVIDAGSPVALPDFLVSDEAGGSSTITPGATEVAFDYRGIPDVATFGDGFTGIGTGSGYGTGFENGFQLDPTTDADAGFSLDIAFTPREADVMVGSSRNVWEIGGTSNGTGLYLIDGDLYFVSKMNSNNANKPAALTDIDWDGTGVSIPLSSGGLNPDERVSVALRFTLDALEYSVNGAAPVTQALANRGGSNNWRGTPDVNIGDVDPNTGQRGGLTTDAGSPFFTDNFASMTDGTASVLYARLWNATDGSITNTAGSAETVTATVTIRNWTSDAVEGSLSASSGNGESYSNGVWQATGLSSVNAALNAIEYTPGSEPLAVLDITIDDQTSVGATTGTIIIANSAPSVVYVDDDFTENMGDPVTDADQVTAGDQGAIFGYSAFRTVSGATSVVDPAGLIVVNDGDYSGDSATLSGTMSLQLTDSSGGVTIGTLGADDGTSIDLQGNDLTLGDDTATVNVIAPISGSGSVTKIGTGRVILRKENTFTGDLVVSDGFLRLGSVGVDPSNQGSVDGNVVVNAPGVFEINAVETGTSMTHSTLISGDGSVAATGPGSVTFDGPANTFSGNFVLGFGTTSDINETLAVGTQNGIVVIGDSGHLGTGLVESRGAQLRASASVNIANNVEIYGGGLRIGGTNDIELSGTITPVGGLRGLGNYGGDGLTVTLSGAIDLDGGGVPQQLNLDGIEGQDNGDFIVSADISGSSNFGINLSLDNSVVTFTGTNSYFGITDLGGDSLVLMNGTHVNGGTWNVSNNAVLGGTGSIDSLVLVNGPASLAPGSSIGSLTIGFGLTFGDNSTYSVEIDSSVPSADLTDSDLPVTIGANVTLDVSDIAGSPAVLPLGTKLTIIDYFDDVAMFNNVLTGEFAGLADGATVSIGANQFVIDYDDDLKDAAGAPGSDGAGDSVTLTAAGASSAYATWAAGYPGLTGDIGDDDDNDGVTNGFEWYFYNTDPTVANSHGAAIGNLVSTGPGTFTFSHLRPIDRSGASDEYEWSADLTTWTPAGGTEGGVTVTIVPGVPTPDANPDYENVEVTVTVAPGTEPKVFVRLALSES